MVYSSIKKARFLSRPNRFIAMVELEGQELPVHVKNTGRCRELLVPDATVYLEPSGNPSRKTAYSLVAVDKGSLLINMDSQAPNQVVEEALRQGWIPPGLHGPITGVRREYTWGNSRFDFYLEADGRPTLMEVKGVTLEQDGLALFPDAPTQRGVKHLTELIRAREEGFGAWVVFVVQMAGMTDFAPNDATHPAFGEALRQAKAAGVGLCACSCRVTPDSLTLGAPLPIRLEPLALS